MISVIMIACVSYD